MSRTAIAILAVSMASPLAAQQTIPVEDAPFAESGTLAGRIDADADLYPRIPDAELADRELGSVRVVDATGQRIGNIQGVLIRDGAVDGIVVNVGGVMGFFDSPRLIPLDRVTVGQSAAGDVRALLDMTKDELAAMPEFTAPEDDEG